MNLKSKWMLTGVSSILALSVLMPSASANTSILNELEQKKQEAEERKMELDSGIEKKAEEITINQSHLEEILEKIENLNSKVAETEGQIKSVEQKIAQTKDEIAELRASIDELEQKIDERTELLQERARAIQLSGGSVDYIDVLLGANSFIDFIDRFSAVNTLIDADRKIMREQAEDKELLAEQKASVETKLAEQEDRNTNLVSLKNSLDEQKEEQAKLAKELEAEQKRLASEKAELEDQHGAVIEMSEELEEKIAAEQKRLAELARKAEEERQRKLEAARKAAAAKAAAEKAAAEQAAKEKAAAERAAAEKAAAEQAAREKAAAKNAAERRAAEEREAAARAAAAKKEQESNKATPAPAPAPASPAATAPAASSAMFIKPSPGRLTSNFGGRDIGAGNENHRGIDVAVDTGTTVSASAAGYVSYASSMGTYGNVVMITHSIAGKNYTTVYAHLDSISVSTGQYVKQGERIAASGNTGRSTGPHLHFEIHIGPWNGSRSNAVNPLNYIN